MQQISVAFYHRDHFSQGHLRKAFGYEAFHWAILISPPTGQGRICQAFEATDSNEIDPITIRMTNPSMDWWLKARAAVDPALSAKMLGRIVIGHIPDAMSNDELKNFFGGVPLPVKNTHPQQSCVTWVIDAIRSMQKRGWIGTLDLGDFKDVALAYADERMKRQDSIEPAVKFHGVPQE